MQFIKLKIGTIFSNGGLFFFSNNLIRGNIILLKKDFKNFELNKKQTFSFLPNKLKHIFKIKTKYLKHKKRIKI